MAWPVRQRRTRRNGFSSATSVFSSGLTGCRSRRKLRWPITHTLVTVVNRDRRVAGGTWVPIRLAAATGDSASAIFCSRRNGAG